ncbi:MAG: cyclic nucleotide-binding domain-containing protein [Pseudomonadota bacterium]|nr:cyclic nucleotide-binding domain-containing protein [Pseudomonadota bacterium]
MFEKQQLEGVRFNAGDILFNEGEKSFQFYVIQEGRVEIHKKGPKGNKLSIAVVEEGHSLGEFALLDQQPRSATAQALTEVRAVMVDEAAYNTILDELPDWARSMLTSLAERLRKANVIIGKLDADTRENHKFVEGMEYSSPTSAALTEIVKEQKARQ